MKRITIPVLLLISAIVIVSCGEDPGGSSAVLSPEGPGPRDDPGFSLDDLDYESFSGTLTPGATGLIYHYMTTWQRRDCRFSLEVPEASMPPGDPIEFEVRIPTKASYLEYEEELTDRLIIRLSPDGTQFEGPINIEGTWMPWQNPPPDPLYFYNGSQWDVATVTYVPRSGLYRVAFSVPHFSDWEIGPEPPAPSPGK